MVLLTYNLVESASVFFSIPLLHVHVLISNTLAQVFVIQLFLEKSRHGTIRLLELL